MADRNRRKSSILKLPKSNARAPLQDVNTLEVKSSLDDDLTSYTALARRRVSFAGKNFVKEFCSEADIVSVYHAPEYEELLASAESSGLVTSDSSNTHSSTTMSENNSTFGSRTQLSAFKSVSIQDEYDPCDEIMQQFKGKKAPQTQAQAHKPSGKTRLSFGDIRLPNFEAEDAPAVQTSTGNLENCTSHKIMDAHKSNLMTRTQNVNPVLGSTSVYQEQNVQLASQNINLLGQEHQIANHERDKADHQKVFANTEEERKSQVDRFLFEGILAQPDHQASPPSLVGALVPTPTMEDSVFESHVNVVYSSSEAPKTGVDVDCGLADTTQCMNESMDFTRGVPGVIHIGFLENPVADDNQIQLEHIRESLPHSKTQIMCTSMEFTQALPSNIQIDFQHGNTAFLGERENKICNSKKAKNTSMKPSSPLPSDIQVDFPIGRTTGVLQTEKEAANQTEAMDSSMEMTRPLPSNIQVGLASNYLPGIPHKESSMANCTMAMHTSMEMTRPLPSNIQVGLASDDIAGIPLKESSISNCTTAMETSMEMTRPLPSNILVGLASNDIGGIPHKESGMANCTMAMDMSMEMTRPLPSNIQVGLASNDIAGIPLKESSVSNCTTAMETSMEMTRPLPSNIQVGLASNDIAGNPHKESGVKNPSSSFKDGFDKGGNVESNIRQQSFTIRSSEVHELLTKDPPMEIEDSFVLAADPFKSKPRLHSSPPRQSGIEAVNVQSLSKKVADPFQVGAEHMQSGMSLSNMSDITRTMPNELHEKPLSKTYIGSDPDKPKVTSTLLHNVKATVEEEVRSLEVPPRTAGITETSPRTKPHFSGSKSPNSIALKAVIEGNVSQKASSKSEHPTLFLDVSNPFKSKSRLMISPIKHSNEFSVHVSPSNKEADGQNSEVKKDDCKQPITADLLCDISKHHPMLFDEPHPFQDVPSFTMEISASINDSGANLLHTTIRNAEITLRQMHSPDLGEMQPISRNKEKSCLVKALEDMDCDPIPSQGTSLAQLPCNEANSQITSREDGGSIIKKSSSNDTDPIENIKTAKRLRDHSLDCERVDPDTSDESSSSKRLCKLRPVAVSKECQETLNDTFGSNLSGKMSEMHSSFGSNRNCSNASSSDSSNASSSDDLVRSLDDIVLNPKLWIAIKKGEDLWSFSFTHMCIELKVHLKMSSTAKGIVEGSHGHFISHVTDSTKPIMRWSMKILMDKLQTEEWDRLLHHSLNFLDTMRKLSDTVIEIKRFMAEAIAQEGLLNLKYTPSSFSTIIISFKLHLCFQVTVELDLLEKYTPDHITVVNIFGKVREQEVKNLVTGVKKDRFFVRNYIRDIKDYVVTLESFCK